MAKDLDSECEQALASMDRDTTFDDVLIGSVRDFDAEGLRSPSFDITVRGGLVYLSPNPSEVHQNAVELLCDSITESLSQASLNGNLHFRQRLNAAIAEVPDVFGCTTVHNRSADLMTVILDDQWDVRNFLMATEITFRNGRLTKAVSVGASYLLPWSDVLFSLLIVLHENPEHTNVESITVLLLKRLNEIQSITGAAQPNQDDCREPLPVHKGISSSEIERLYPVAVAKNMMVSWEDVDNPEADLRIVLQIDDICRRSGMDRHVFNGSEITIDLREYFRRLFQRIDHLVNMGKYPFGKFRIAQ